MLSPNKVILVLPRRMESKCPAETGLSQKETEEMPEGFSFSEEKEGHAALSPSDMTVPAFYMDALSYEIFFESKDMPPHRKRYIIDYIRMLKQIQPLDRMMKQSPVDEFRV